MVRNASGLRDHVDVSADWVDMQTIRRRVAEIKRGWSKAERCARSVEGVRRREELARLLMEPHGDDDPSIRSCARASLLRLNDSSLVG